MPPLPKQHVGGGTATEAAILTSLNVPQSAQSAIMSGAARLLILDCSAHLDWDWLLPFPALSAGGSGQRATWFWNTGKAPTNQIFESAARLLVSQSEYHYSICEMGFLRAFANSDPNGFHSLAENAAFTDNLRITGGGITSPDNLISHGEAFIRAYLLGHGWLAQSFTVPPAPVTAWLPDDFGHDVNLPIVIQAMGLSAAGFERVPGGKGASAVQPLNGTSSIATLLKTTGIDFTWTAPDGSSILAHWLIGGYQQGNTVASASDITDYLNLNAPSSPTPYVYVPVLDDFSPPNQNVSSIIAQNSPMTWISDQGQTETVYLAAGSFEDYAQLVQYHAVSAQTFNPTPYWTGYFATRPALKQLHQRATRNLLAAEVFSLIANLGWPDGWTSSLGTGDSAAQVFNDAWNLLVPSTHHDYVTGTAIPDVYHREQLLLSRQAAERAQWLCEDAIEAIAAAITPRNTDGTPVAVFNSLGFSRSEVVELTAAEVHNAQLSVSGAGYQTTQDGGLLFLADAPSMGYRTAYLSNGGTVPQNPVSVTLNPGSCVLSNGLVRATLTPGGNQIWGLTSVVDSRDGEELIQSGTVANDFVFYLDTGDEYSFGMESNTTVWSLQDVSGNLSSPTIKVLESGPLRGHVITEVTYKDQYCTIKFVREYILLANETILRMRSTGAAPMLGGQGSSVLVKFPLSNVTTNGIDTIAYGTPHHWTSAPPSAIYWNDQTFLATHNFVIPYSSGRLLASIYHFDVHAWGISHQWNDGQFEPNDGILYGCLWRNGDGSYFDWVNNGDSGLQPAYLPYGTDSETHVREYALKMPSSASHSPTGKPLREALAFTSPMRARVLEPIASALPESLSLVSSNDGTLVTVAKSGTVTAGDVVLRVYCSANEPTDVTLTFDTRVSIGGATQITALEQPVASPITITPGNRTLSFQAPTALTTIAIAPQ